VRRLRVCYTLQVTVYIPNAETANQNLLIVGEAANCENAEKHVLRLIEKVDERAKVCVDCTCEDKRALWCRFVVYMNQTVFLRTHESL
jgi:CO dehydrogenase/acetyl-CoA synthase epsilon subunit